MNGQEKFAAPQGAVLAIFAVEGAQQRSSEDAERFAKGVPQAQVVQLHHASHFVFNSNEADVLKEITSFSAALH